MGSKRPCHFVRKFRISQPPPLFPTLRTLLKRRTNETTTVYTVHKDVQRPDSQARPQSFTLSSFSSLLPSTFVFLWLSSLAIRMISTFSDSWAPILFWCPYCYSFFLRFAFSFFFGLDLLNLPPCCLAIASFAFAF